jgi:hypothetical protein
LRELGLLEIEDYDVYMNSYGEDLPSVRLRPKHIPGLAADFQTVTDTTPTLADAVKALLPKVGRFEKGFDEGANEITMTATFKGVKIVLRDATPSTCTVEKVEEEVPSRVVGGYKTTKYRLVGDCDPLLSQTEAAGA